MGPNKGPYFIEIYGNPRLKMESPDYLCPPSSTRVEENTTNARKTYLACIYSPWMKDNKKGKLFVQWMSEKRHYRGHGCAGM
jgi:hypothetical protein